MASREDTGLPLLLLPRSAMLFHPAARGKDAVSTTGTTMHRVCGPFAVGALGDGDGEAQGLTAPNGSHGEWTTLEGPRPWRIAAHAILTAPPLLLAMLLFPPEWAGGRCFCLLDRAQP